MTFKLRKRERGATLLEFAIGATVFLTALFAVVEFGRLLWVHNALRDAARRGTRYATIRKNDSAGVTAVKKMVVYGDPNADPASATPVVPGLTTGHVNVQYNNYNGLQLSSKAMVTINGYQFNFAVPIVGGAINMPNYKTSLPGESAGYVPCDLPSGSPMSACAIIPD